MAKDTTVTAPKNLNRTIAGVTFIDGVGTADSVADTKALAFFARQGWPVVSTSEADIDPNSITPIVTAKPIVTATKTELLEWAAAQTPEITTVNASMTKAQILAAINGWTDDGAITISVHPANDTVVAPAPGEFSVTTSAGTGITYQWQVMQGGDGDWADIEDATDDEYTTGATTVEDDNGDKYRVVLTNGRGSVTSNAATLTVTAE